MRKSGYSTEGGCVVDIDAHTAGPEVCVFVRSSRVYLEIEATPAALRACTSFLTGPTPEKSASIGAFNDYQATLALNPDNPRELLLSIAHPERSVLAFHLSLQEGRQLAQALGEALNQLSS